MKPHYEMADIFRLYGDQYRKSHVMNDEQRKVMRAIEACRTAQLGGHSDTCNSCGATQNSYNSCRNRHCPKCQTMTKEDWLSDRKRELLPCGYFHLVFTVPHILNLLILNNRKTLLDLLFSSVSGTLKAFAADPQWHLEGVPGALIILHTWSQTLIDHFHLHCLVPAGVLSFDKRHWHASGKKFLFRPESLAKEFKKRYLSAIEANLNNLSQSEDSRFHLRQAKAKKWVVYAKKPFAGPKRVLEYLGRYTHRIAISNHRILSIDNGKIVFTYKNREDNKTEKMTLLPEEFIRRFLLHVLPYRFMKIRYYGFMANKIRRKSILLIRRLIGIAMEIEPFIKESLQEKILRITGKDIYLCPKCKQGRMICQRILLPDRS
ncbi:MAG: IS91 family transposase [Anaerolineaceae bacterium]|nr:IS91 family transposase [Anaerolineaceae bacterium]